MINILVAFPKQENARSMKSILVRNGYEVTAVCQTGAQVLSAMEDLEEGILVCGYAFPDMIYLKLHEDLRPGFQMLVVTNPGHCGEISADDLLYLAMPFKTNEVLSSIQMMERDFVRKKKIRSKQPKVRDENDQKIIREAKRLLMEQHHMTETEAHRYLQKTSMDSGNNLVETAEMIQSIMMAQ